MSNISVSERSTYVGMIVESSLGVCVYDDECFQVARVNFGDIGTYEVLIPGLYGFSRGMLAKGILCKTSLTPNGMYIFSELERLSTDQVIHIGGRSRRSHHPYTPLLPV